MHNSILHRLYIVVRVHHPSQVSSHQLYPLYPLLPPSTPFPSGNRHTVCVYEGLCVGGGRGGTRAELLYPFTKKRSFLEILGA